LLLRISHTVIFPALAPFISAPLEIAVTNDTAVYDAVRIDPINGGAEWAGRMGTRNAIARDGLTIDTASLAYCPHEWLNESGYVDLECVRSSPRLFAL
jgi:hypothetical protein